MSARRQIIAALSEDSLGGIATLADVDHAEQLVDALVAEVLGEAKREVVAWLVKKAREGTPIEQLASKVDRGAIRIFLGSEPYAEPLIVDRFDTAMEPALEEEQVFVVGSIAENGRPVALYFAPEDRRKVAGWLAPDKAEAAPLTVFRASHDAIVMGHYASREAAMDHVHATLANEEGGDVTARVIWRADDPEADEPEWECWLFDADMADDSPTGYVVTPLEVAAKYDPEADE